MSSDEEKLDEASQEMEGDDEFAAGHVKEMKDERKWLFYWKKTSKTLTFMSTFNRTPMMMTTERVKLEVPTLLSTVSTQAIMIHLMVYD